MGGATRPFGVEVWPDEMASRCGSCPKAARDSSMILRLRNHHLWHFLNWYAPQFIALSTLSPLSTREEVMATGCFRRLYIIIQPESSKQAPSFVYRFSDLLITFLCQLHVFESGNFFWFFIARIRRQVFFLLIVGRQEEARIKTVSGKRVRFGKRYWRAGRYILYKSTMLAKIKRTQRTKDRL